MNSLSLLLTNDDGVDAAGLAALHAAASQLGNPLIVAPAECQSGCGHRVTTNAAFRVHRRDAARYVVEGTPADCVRVALDQIQSDVGWVLSGINHGGNLGSDLFTSGTAAAVREAVLHGLPGIAVSHYHRKEVDPLDWPRATRWIVPIVRDLMNRPVEPGTFWNINLPHLAPGSADPPVVFCPVDPSPLPVKYEPVGDALRYRGNYHERRRAPGSDVDICFQGKIAISLVEVFRK
jgi:5'-nucleotidase